MKSKISMILFVLILGSVLTTALVSVDSYTKPFIAKNKVKKLRQSILQSLGIVHTKDNTEEAFSDNVEIIENNQIKFYRASKRGDVAFEFQGLGLWGPIHGTIALTSDLTTIKGINITHQEETPGLGGRIAEADFLSRFNDKNVASGMIIQPPGKASRNNEVDGITGATLSCKAFEKILNREIKKYVSIIKEAR
ncbi:MAG: FMN-binding protein [Planctomycetota bacterium]|jgi:Na+-transporting NADH:ubiquinone oxidoreductase subunit C